MPQIPRFLLPRVKGVTVSKWPMFNAKDFIETDEGLLFAVVADGVEGDKVLCFLRYRHWQGRWQKVGTDDANQYLQQHFPYYLHYSQIIDASLHAVEQARIIRHYRPQTILKELLNGPPADTIVEDLQQLCQLLQHGGVDLQYFGVTGSMLIGMQNHASDIDLVCYDRDVFHRARNVVQALIAQDRCQALNDADWLSAYQRRACDFAFDEYIWHEQRKYNKAMINQRKFDLSLTGVSGTPEPAKYRKLGHVRIETTVIDATHSFDYPAKFVIDHPEIDAVVCFTATYNGQALDGECIVVAGQLEEGENGGQRIVVGSKREAIGEFIKVIR
jgi:uncharacterized protein